MRNYLLKAGGEESDKLGHGEDVVGLAGPAVAHRVTFELGGFSKVIWHLVLLPCKLKRVALPANSVPNN